jgi:hypothetical protein
VPVQRDADSAPSPSSSSSSHVAAPVDRAGGGAALPRSTRAQAIADAGTATGGARLPHQGAIQRSFGHHDVSGVRAHVGGEAAAAAAALGARAYATGDRVAFGSAPDLHLAAHEAAHVVQQRAGVYLKDGLGDSGDVYERHADEVADAVVRGDSAVGLLDRMAPGGAGGRGGQVQRKEGTLGEVFRYGGHAALEPAGFATSGFGEQKQNFLYAGHEERFAYLCSGIAPGRAATLIELLDNVLDAVQLIDRWIPRDPQGALLRALDRSFVVHGISITGAHPLGVRVFRALPRLEQIAVFPRLDMLDTQRELVRALGTDAPVNELLIALPDERLVAVGQALGDAYLAQLYVWQDPAGRARFARLFTGAAVQAAVKRDDSHDPGGAHWTADGAAADARLDSERNVDPRLFLAQVSAMAGALQRMSADDYAAAPEDRRRAFLRGQSPPVAAMYLAMEPGDPLRMLRVFADPAKQAKVLVLYMQSTGNRGLAARLTSDELIAVIAETPSPTLVGEIVASLPPEQMAPVLPALSRTQLGRAIVRAPDPDGTWHALRSIPPETINQALTTITHAEATAVYLALSEHHRRYFQQTAPPQLLGQLVLSPEYGTAT